MLIAITLLGLAGFLVEGRIIRRTADEVIEDAAHPFIGVERTVGT